MEIIPCPNCGCMPNIVECMPLKDGIRRRMCYCKSHCAVIPNVEDHYDTLWFIYRGDSDEDDIYTVWNKCIERYNKNKNKPHMQRDYSMIDSHIELSAWMLAKANRKDNYERV